MNTFNDLSGLTASDTARLVRQRDISPVEVIDAAIKRVEQRNGSLNALIYTDFEQARQHARALEAKIMKGIDPGLLAGVPTAMKDLYLRRCPGTEGFHSGLREHLPGAYRACRCDPARQDQQPVARFPRNYRQSFVRSDSQSV
jgi:hypothetical protein